MWYMGWFCCRCWTVWILVEQYSEYPTPKAHPRGRIHAGLVPRRDIFSTFCHPPPSQHVTRMSGSLVCFFFACDNHRSTSATNSGLVMVFVLHTFALFSCFLVADPFGRRGLGSHKWERLESEAQASCCSALGRYRLPVAARASQMGRARGGVHELQHGFLP